VDFEEQGEALASAGGVHESTVVIVEAELEDGAASEFDDRLVLTGVGGGEGGGKGDIKEGWGESWVGRGHE
jgi:hypothetical protein